jgi:hypothetical protein
MANKLYDKGRGKFATGDLHWKSAGGDTFKVFLIDLASYTPDFAADEFLSDIPAAARVGNSGGDTEADAPALTTGDPSAAGVCDANDITFQTVPAGGALEALVIFKATGNPATSPLVAYIDSATGLPITPNGGNIGVVWDNGANKIFKL